MTDLDEIMPMLTPVCDYVDRVRVMFDGSPTLGRLPCTAQALEGSSYCRQHAALMGESVGDQP